LHQTYSLVKVDPRRERIVESPDDLISLKIKPSEVEWVRNHLFIISDPHQCQKVYNKDDQL